MASLEQPDKGDYVVISDVLYVDGHIFRKGERLGPTTASPRLYHLLAHSMIKRVEEEDPDSKTC